MSGGGLIGPEGETQWRPGWEKREGESEKLEWGGWGGEGRARNYRAQKMAITGGVLGEQGRGGPLSP